MENIQNQQNNNTDNNIQPLVSLVNLISDNLNNPNPNNNYLNQNYTEKKEDNNNIISIDEKKEKEKEKDDILLEIDQIIGKETIENTFKSTQEDNSSNLNKSENVMEIGENHFLKSDNNVNNNNYSSTYNISKETLDEAIITTINRDLYSIYIKLIFVINPFISDEVKKYHIKQWDLWGPLIFNVLLASTLAINSDNRGQTIILIFLIFWLGSFLVFLNGHLLGVKTSIFQIFCLLGYCLFPLNLSAFILSFTKFLEIIRFILISITCFWSLYSTSSFLRNISNPEQRYLVLYPSILLYLYISWFIFVTKH
jgi:hypothetical protein